MRTLLLLICLVFVSFAGRSQTTESPKYFAQCMLNNIEDETVFRNLEDELRLNPYVQVVRLDWISKRAFLLTKDLSAFSIEQFRSWLGEYAVNASCIQVGLHGTDPVNPYPFTNCEN